MCVCVCVVLVVVVVFRVYGVCFVCVLLLLFYLFVCLFPWVLRRTDTLYVIWRRSSFTGWGSPQVPFHALFQATEPDRTMGVPQASWIASSYERIQSPCRYSNSQRWGEGGLKSTTLTTGHGAPFVSISLIFSRHAIHENITVIQFVSKIP